MPAILRKIKAGLAIGVAAVACPCHLPLTIPVLLSATAGSSLGILFSPLIFSVLSIALFVVSGFLAIRWLGKSNKEAVCETDVSILEKQGGPVRKRPSVFSLFSSKLFAVDRNTHGGGRYEYPKKG